MIVLLDTPQDHEECGKELGCEVGQLLTPLTRRAYRGGLFAVDNGAFAGFKSKPFLSLLERNIEHRDNCKFVCVPDIVGSARRTAEVFDDWHWRLPGWPLALVAQDGIEHLPIPWRMISAIFIGGSTEFKIGPHAEAVIRAAQALDKWVHVGRVNTTDRFEKFKALGVDSIDGTGISRYSHMRKNIAEGTPLLPSEEFPASILHSGGCHVPGCS